ncbi:hypothetical protein BV898_12507 [Hypsibius exemplaris]|uniref:Uncharacterized protein n=1 Tax=Hypsibius exemplaris TaxID=2072580 RepID=A0A1W0WDL1_HYPEX|nr:hypothetical protein BV898_12507 [Hypsibius exemplaris]
MVIAQVHGRWSWTHPQQNRRPVSQPVALFSPLASQKYPLRSRDLKVFPLRKWEFCTRSAEQATIHTRVRFDVIIRLFASSSMRVYLRVSTARRFDVSQDPAPATRTTSHIVIIGASNGHTVVCTQTRTSNSKQTFLKSASSAVVGARFRSKAGEMETAVVVLLLLMEDPKAFPGVSLVCQNG